LILLITAVSRADAQNIVYGTLDASLDDGSLAGPTFQVTFSYDADLDNITFGFGADGVIGYIDLDGQFGSGSFTFESTDGCSYLAGTVNLNMDRSG
jgi:hypothetical protein